MGMLHFQSGFALAKQVRKLASATQPAEGPAHSIRKPL